MARRAEGGHEDAHVATLPRGRSRRPHDPGPSGSSAVPGAQDGIDVAIVGARSDRNIEGSLAAVDVELTADDLAEIERLTADAVQVSGTSPEGIA